MADEPTKTQELLAILETRPWTKTERANARQQIGFYYERKLASLQRTLFEVIAQRNNPFEIDEYIHCYHKQSQELYVHMNYRSSSNEALPMWLRAIDEDDQGIAVWQPKTRLPHEDTSSDQKKGEQRTEESSNDE